MGRRLRPNLPGATFHVTGRLQHREQLFAPALRTKLVALLREQVGCSDVELFAYVIMPNHLHVVVRQGSWPLSRFMQPFARRVALLIQRSKRREGHVFERRYRARPCADPEHLRNAIVYTHLNPVRAGLCNQAEDYEWSSYGAWIGRGSAADDGVHPVALERPMQLFACGPDRPLADLRGDYIAFQQWREACDRIQAEHGGKADPLPLPSRPVTTHGDANWAHYVAPRPEAVDGLTSSAVPHTGCATGARPDLSAIARSVLNGAGPGLVEHWVRSRWGGPTYVRARHSIIRQATAAGYRPAKIAAYLRLSGSAVSAVLTADRKRLLESRR